MNFSSRLRQARAALGLTQADMAEKCGVSKRSQIHFEKGEQMPGGAYLQRLAELGVDVTALLTGDASATPAAPRDDLAPEERALVDNYRAASPERRAALREIGAAVAQPQRMKTAK